MKTNRIKQELQRQPWGVVWNVFLVFVCYTLCRIEFLCENWDIFRTEFEWSQAWTLFRGGLRFDASAICYTNILYMVLALFPLHFKERPLYNKILKWLFVVVNGLMIVVNLCDSVYFPYTQQRTTAIVFDEFQNETNLSKIVGVELINHWYLVLMAAVLIFGLWKLYRKAPTLKKDTPLVPYYVREGLSLVVVVLLAICGMRGVFYGVASRPISTNEAFRYTEIPTQTAIVLNTPFSIIRTFSERTMKTPQYFSSQAELDSIYSPVHYPRPDRVVRKKNVCILIVESFAKEFIGSLNKDLDGGKYKGYTPFADELIAKSLTWRETYANAAFSIDAMPAVLASIPRMGRPFVVGPYSLNDINGLPSLLKTWGYSSAFFHGAHNGSMGFAAFARSAGFQKYYGMTEFCDDKRFGGKKQFDGTWGIWDEPFLQFFAAKMGEMKQPFVTAVFTLSSHHPFNIPEQYRDTFPDEGKYALHKCIRYTDHSLRRFFETASKQPWYKNTIFILSADHASSRITHKEYMNDLGHFRIPIIFFDPSGELGHGMREGIAQQMDIMPTLLSWLGYDKPYIAFGKDMLHTAPDSTWAMNWQHNPQYIKGGYTLLFDGKKAISLYDYRHDPMLKHDIKGKRPKVQRDMETNLKAVMQSLVTRMKNNDCVIRKKK